MSSGGPRPTNPGGAGAPDPPESGQAATTSRDDRFDRDIALARLANTHFDVLVVGGGITGAGVALDAASRGLRTALVEKGDFASGTSSRSSKLVHGGLRYLQQREIRLVYENLAERQRLLQNAPHLVTRLPFLIPLFGRDGLASKAVARSYAIALWMYDVTGGLRIGARHRRLSRVEVVRHFPLLDTDRLVAGWVYFDARADDARLTLALLRSAALDHGAVVANYATLEDFVTDPSGRVVGGVVRVVPGGSGSIAAGGSRSGSRSRSGCDEGPEGPEGSERDQQTLVVRARTVVNATGVWADQVAAMGSGTPGHSLVPAKGVHIAVPASRLPCDIAAVIPVSGDRRSIFVVPWADAGLVYLGTTDTVYDGPLDDPRCTPGDVTYLLDAANAVTTAELTPDDVTAVWAGLRPLLAPESGRRVSERTADLSRRHRVEVGDDGVVTVTGGKLTTYRKMAEDTVDAVQRLLPGAGGDRPCVTKQLPIRGARPVAGQTNRLDRLDRLAPGVREHLTSRYGTEAEQVAALADGRSELLDPVIEDLPYLGVEVVYAVRAEMAQTLMDVATRRTRALIQRAEPTIAAAESLATLLAAELGWDADRRAAEVDAFRTDARADLAAAGLTRSGTPEHGGRP